MALKKAATNNAGTEEKAAQHASLIKWTQWIHEGPADGLRRQHRFSRTVNGVDGHGEKHEWYRRHRPSR